MKPILIYFFIAVLLPVISNSAAADPFQRQWKDTSWKKEAKSLAIQSNGRVKPLDTFAREGIELLTGKEKFQGRESIELILSLAFEPHVWQEKKFIQINLRSLKKDLNLKEEENYFSPQDLMHSPRMMPLFQQLEAKQTAQEKLDPYFQAVQRLANQMIFLQEVVSGRALRLIPPTPEQYQQSDAWLGFDRFDDEQKIRFALMAAGFTSTDESVQSKLSDYISKFRELSMRSNESLYPAQRDLKLEVHFNEFRPFRWSWVIALVSAILMGFALYNTSPWLYRSSMGLFVVSFLIQVYGFFLRCWISGRPPVSNMYESVLWVAFGCMMFGLIFELIYKKRVIALGSLVFAVITLVIADNVSGVIDDSIHPLEPVLRNNMWLTVHVLTITLGYAAFALSLVLGNIGLGQIVFTGKESKDFPFRQLAFYAYRATQVGVILLAAGTILGGVWADYSWGRFWGWDPKETWALIALLGYLALIHARFRGMVGPFGFLAGSVVSFMGVLMAWYGVNFVLGAGLHSYGFSSGGVSYVATYCSVQLLFTLWAIFLKNRESRARSSTPPSAT